MKVTTPAYYYLFANNILIDWIWNQYNWIGKTPLWHNLFYREPTYKITICSDPRPRTSRTSR